MKVVIFIVMLIIVFYMIYWIGDVTMWTMYVWVDGHSLADIVKGVSTKRLLEIIEQCTMITGVQMIEVNYGGNVYTVYVRR